MDKEAQPVATTESTQAPAQPAVAAGASERPATAKQQAIQAAARVLTAQLVSGAKHRHGFLHHLEHLVATSVQHVVKDAVALAGSAKAVAVEAAEYIEVGAGEAVGVTELLGLRYPVKAYEAQVDSGLYRGSRLDDAGMASLKQLGIVGVVSLCMEHTDDAALAAKYGLDAFNVKILDNSAPTMEQMQAFIAFATSHKPTYVHCEEGKGRTGVAVACYRIAVDGWTADQAIAEGRTFGLSLINQLDFIHTFAAQTKR